MTPRLFAAAFATLLLALLTCASAFARQSSATDIINALSTGNVFVIPSLKGDVDAGALAAAAANARPTVVKIVVVAKTGNYPSRAALADDLRQRLVLDDNAVVLVGTPKGISASSGRLSRDQADSAMKNAHLDEAFAQGGLTQALTKAVAAVSGEAVHDRKVDTAQNSGLLIGGFVVVGGLIAFAAAKKQKAMANAKAPIEALRQQVIANLSYVDGYLDLLPKGDDGEKARTLRASAYEEYETATGLLQNARSPEDFGKADPVLRHALAQLTECRQAIDRATGGTGVAMGLLETPSLATPQQKAESYLKSVEQVQSAQERDQLQRELDGIPVNERGVSFFSGRPLPASELVPVTMVIQGKKRTVMATRDEADSIARGQTPQVRAFDDGAGRYVPWYEYRGYDPYRDYYGYWGSPLGSFIDLYLLTNLMGPGMYGGYGPWGWGGFGYGMPMPPVVVGGDYGNYGGGYGGDYGGGGVVDGNTGGGYSDTDFFGGDVQMDPTPDHSGSVDFFGQGGYSEQDTSGGGSFDFDTSDSGGGGFDSGSFDSGGDFGGGGDSGGGGGDFG